MFRDELPYNATGKVLKNKVEEDVRTARLDLSCRPVGFDSGLDVCQRGSAQIRMQFHFARCPSC